MIISTYIIIIIIIIIIKDKKYITALYEGLNEIQYIFDSIKRKIHIRNGKSK